MEMDWVKTLGNFAARKDDIIVLDDGGNPALLPYLDLIDGRSKRPELMPEAVVQVQKQPLLYLYSEARLTSVSDNSDPLPRIKRLMAMRGDAAFIGILRPGVLQLHSTASDSKKQNRCSEIKEDEEGQWLIPRIAQGKSPVAFAEKFIETEMFRLLDETAKQLRVAGLPVAEIVSLTGRALFLRFLLDRNILPRGQIAPYLGFGTRQPEDSFISPASAAATCRWLDQTFNGDLLPLPDQDPDAYFLRLGQSNHGKHIFSALQAILHFDDPLGAGFYQARLDWGDLHLAHVPVGLLSQVYERYMELFYPEARKETSAYYTPRHIAEIMVDEAFYGLNQAHQAKVLDPAAGAGVFLVAAFHKLVEERWRHDGKRPNREVLRQILNQQIRGFDINSHALKLSALSLYLTRLELDPDPTPLQDLRFEALQGNVLFNWSSNNVDAELESRELLKPIPGSLGDQVGKEHEGVYDVVIGNPPWSAHGKGNKELKNLYTSVSRRMAMKRGVQDAETYANPDGVPDLPFLWRSMEWARPGGRIALALHGRWLFKQSETGIQSRNGILQAVNITGVLNGAALRKTHVWPRVSAPFCLVFAVNSIPDPSSGFYFVSPQLDPDLNKEGKLRIDAQSAEPVLNREAIYKSWLLKSLFRGNRLSSKVVDKVLSLNLPTVEQFWGNNHLYFGEGYQLAESSNPKSSDFLLGRLALEAAYSTHPFSVEIDELDIFTEKNVYFRGKREIYRQPLVVIKEKFPFDRNVGRALAISCNSEIAFCDSYFGLSCFGYTQAELLMRYLLVLFHSRFVLFYFLSTSSKFGVERPTPLCSDTKHIPFFPLENLNPDQIVNIERFANHLIDGASSPPWAEIDELIENIYGLNHWDRQVIEDTLKTYIPEDSPEAKQAAEPSTAEQKYNFTRILSDSMTPFFPSLDGSLIFIFAKTSVKTLGRLSTSMQLDNRISLWVIYRKRF